MRHLLVGDIGGTKTALYLYAQEQGGAFRELQSQRFASADYPGLLPIVQAFLRTSESQGTRGVASGSLCAAAFGVAGPVRDGTSKTTNLPWIIEASSLRAALGVPVSLINDFHAIALGIAELEPSSFQVLQQGARDPHGAIAILGAGTGLGEAIALPSRDGLRVLESEGGHVDFAPRSELEFDLLRFLWGRHARVSVERVVSGPGLKALYDFVVARGLEWESPAVRARFASEDPSQVIGELGLLGSDPACVRALDLFASLYGSEAGNLALKVLPRGGLFVSGGIAPKLISKLQDGTFMRAMVDKGRLSVELERLHVAVVMDPLVGILGARALAARSAASAAP